MIHNDVCGVASSGCTQRFIRAQISASAVGDAPADHQLPRPVARRFRASQMHLRGPPNGRWGTNRLDSPPSSRTRMVHGARRSTSSRWGQVDRRLDPDFGPLGLHQRHGRYFAYPSDRRDHRLADAATALSGRISCSLHRLQPRRRLAGASARKLIELMRASTRDFGAVPAEDLGERRGCSARHLVVLRRRPFSAPDHRGGRLKVFDDRGGRPWPPECVHRGLEQSALVD